MSAKKPAKIKNINTTVTGNRSKAEQLIIDMLRFHFKRLKVSKNDKTAINKELDIYLPDMKIAIEVNGPTHYRVVFSEEQLSRAIKNDALKAKLCEEAGIKLISIRLPENSSTYVDFLRNEIKNNIVAEIRDWNDQKERR